MPEALSHFDALLSGSALNPPPPPSGGAQGVAPEISPRAYSTGRFAARKTLHMTNLFDEVASGDRGRALQALRRLLAERIAANPRPRDLAALSYRLMKVIEELDDTHPRRRRGRRT